jgi:hypothetical protein
MGKYQRPAKYESTTRMERERKEGAKTWRNRRDATSCFSLLFSNAFDVRSREAASLSYYHFTTGPRFY